jgi:D-aminoacyl-tRNA deacylase
MQYKLLLCSEADTASVNIRNALMEMRGWETSGDLLFFDDMVMMTIPEMHIYAENLDDKVKAAGIDAKEVIFLSRHRSSSEIPTLTVHPIGNFNDAELGGRPRTLVKASPGTMTGLLRSLLSSETGRFRVSFEVTHHGPWTSIPATFIEIGSSEAQWNDRDAAKMLADAILGHDDRDFMKVIGTGGGHYAPRFTEAAASYEMNFGHMIPEYAYKDADHEETARMMKDSAEKSDTKMIYVHKRSMKADAAKRIEDIVSSCGLESVETKDVTPIRN